MIKKIALALVAVVLVLLVVVALRPATFVIERSTDIAAPAAMIQPHIESPRAMNQWSPFATADPEMKITYTGPEAGVGAASSWESAQMGDGRMTVVAVRPAQEVDFKLEFFRPFASTNRALFTLAPAGDATRVTWRMEGNNGFAGKAMSLVMDMDAMLGAEFEKGLASLKALTEAQASATR